MAVHQTAAAGARGIHYAWTVVGVAFFTFLVAAGVRAAPAVFIVPLEQEFGWSRAAISSAIGIQLFLYGLIGPFSAGFVERFGLRRMMLVALIAIVLSFGCTPFVGTVWQLWIVWGVGVGLGTGAVALVLAAVIANRWFVTHRGLAMGLMTGSSAAGQMVFIPSLANIVMHVGWHAAVWTGCVATAFVIPLVYLFMRDRPADMGLRPYGLAPDAAAEPVPPRLANPVATTFAVLGEAVGVRDFWLLSASFFVCGASTIGLIGTHFIPACLDHGIPESESAELLAAMGVCNIIGTMASGWLTDRFDSRYLLFWYYATRGVALLFLPYALDNPSAWSLGFFGLFYGFDWITTVPPTVRLTVQTFGAARAGIFYGWIMVMHQLGAATFAYASGVLRTTLGDYLTAFMVSGALCFVAALLVLRVGRPSRAAPRPALADA